MSEGRVEELEAEVRMLRGSLEAVAAGNRASSPTKMAAIAKRGLEASRERVTLTEAVEKRSLIGGAP